MKILTLTVSAGSGHSKASEAINDYFNKNYPDVETKTINTLKYINPVIDKLVIGSYLNALKKTPAIYAKLFSYAESDDAVSNITQVVNDLLSIKIKNLIDKYAPDVIVCTHFFPLEMISILKRKGKIDIPAVAVITDYAPHSIWFYSYIDAYVIPHEDFVQDLIEKGIAKDTIYPYGIPINEEFMDEMDKKACRKELGIHEDALALLLMGGGLGMGNMKSIFEQLAFSNLPAQLIACTGSNMKLKNQLIDISSRCNKKTLIYDFTDNVSSLMSACDILISKPGGLTVTESINKHLPLVITAAIPGHEERNADYLLNNGIAARVKDTDSIVSVIKQLTKSKFRLNHMVESAKEKSKPTATKDICELILNLAKDSKKSPKHKNDKLIKHL
jgi:processive 1,2-diacylglycerol beta-glucosyltransferase